MLIIKKRTIVIVILTFLCTVIHAQDMLQGTVMEYNDKKQLIPVVGAVLQWENSSVGTVTDINGTFKIEKIGESNQLIVKYFSYQNDTISIQKDQKELEVVLLKAHQLNEISVEATRQGSYISVKPILTTVLSADGLRKAACCNLSESFDNTVAVDVEYADAVTGAKQISMLGLAGIYNQILLENTPFIRLLSHQFGLSFVPGVWMEAISIAKGTSSVTNGYEGMTGQINIDYKKPEKNQERFFLNRFTNSMGKGEINLNTRIKIKEHLSTMFLLHMEGQFVKLDLNRDSFLDLPLNYQVNAMNRWDYDKPGKFEGRTLVSYLWEDRVGGQKNFSPRRRDETVYGLRIRTDKFNVITKNGFLLPGHHESIGTILSFTYHQNLSYFGLKDYNAKQLSGYANILYSNRYGESERHKFTAGGSFQVDVLNENMLHVTDDISRIKREYIEMVPGIFTEYSYSIDEKFVLMAGLRFDYNFYYNMLFWTPRLHLKWVPYRDGAIRFSAGKGYRTAHVLVENMSLLINNRTFIFPSELKPEEAYNGGVSFVQSFDMKGGKSKFSVDYFYTTFVNQMIIDLDRSPQRVYVYNLNDKMNKGKSYSHSFQAELTLYPLKRFELIMAYRFNDVWQTTGEDLQPKALMSPHKALLNISYATKFEKWKFNLTVQYNSSMRFPNTQNNPEPYRLPKQSPDYFIVNAQITKKYKTLEIYLGGENLLNYKQKNPILSADNPFGDYFDASMLYAPITGIMGYVGINWKFF